MLLIATLLATLAIAHCVLGVRVCRRLWASDCYDIPQKRIQTALLWLIPVLGLTLVWACLEKPQAGGGAEEALDADGDIDEDQTLLLDALGVDGSDA